MNSVEENPKVQHILQEIGRLVTEMSQMRSQVATPGRSSLQRQSIRESQYFGMWAGREDMQGKSSREWLQKLRSEQWLR
jgi:hypothetical protein